MLKIFANTWKNYNENGADGGEWIELPMDENELEEMLENIAKNMGDDGPEWFINDVDWDEYKLFDIDENDSIFWANEIVSEISDLDSCDRQKLEAFIEATGRSIQNALEDLDNVNFWPGMTLLDVAYELVEECVFTNDTPDFLQRYFDYGAFARDLAFDGYYEVGTGTICYI